MSLSTAWHRRQAAAEALKTAKENGELRTRVEVKVRDEKGRVLAGKWPDSKKLFLPGGGVEEGETLQQAAKREVAEETGWVVKNVKITKEPPTVVPGESITHWAEAKATGKKNSPLKGADEGKFLRNVRFHPEEKITTVKDKKGAGPPPKTAGLDDDEMALTAIGAGGLLTGAGLTGNAILNRLPDLTPEGRGNLDDFLNVARNARTREQAVDPEFLANYAVAGNRVAGQPITPDGSLGADVIKQIRNAPGVRLVQGMTPMTAEHYRQFSLGLPETVTHMVNETFPGADFVEAGRPQHIMNALLEQRPELRNDPQNLARVFFESDVLTDDQRAVLTEEFRKKSDRYTRGIGPLTSVADAKPWLKPMARGTAALGGAAALGGLGYMAYKNASFGDDVREALGIDSKRDQAALHAALGATLFPVAGGAAGALKGGPAGGVGGVAGAATGAGIGAGLGAAALGIPLAAMANVSGYRPGVWGALGAIGGGALGAGLGNVTGAYHGAHTGTDKFGAWFSSDRDPNEAAARAAGTVAATGTAGGLLGGGIGLTDALLTPLRPTQLDAGEAVLRAVGDIPATAAEAAGEEAASPGAVRRFGRRIAEVPSLIGPRLARGAAVGAIGGAALGSILDGTDTPQFSMGNLIASSGGLTGAGIGAYPLLRYLADTPVAERTVARALPRSLGALAGTALGAAGGSWLGQKWHNDIG